MQPAPRMSENSSESAPHLDRSSEKHQVSARRALDRPHSKIWQELAPAHALEGRYDCGYVEDISICQIDQHASGRFNWQHISSRSRGSAKLLANLGNGLPESRVALC